MVIRVLFYWYKRNGEIIGKKDKLKKDYKMSLSLEKIILDKFCWWEVMRVKIGNNYILNKCIMINRFK